MGVSRQNGCWRFVIAWLAFGSAFNAARAGSYYVATNGLDTHPGTLTSPFATIQHAAQVVHAGDTIYVRGGLYYEDQIALTASGTSTAPITFSSYANEKAVVDFGLRAKSLWQVCKNLISPASCATAAHPDLYVVRPSYGTRGHYHWPSTTRSVIINGQIYSPVPCASSQPASVCLPFMAPGHFFSDNTDKGADYGYLYVYPPDAQAAPTAGALVTIVNFSANKPYIFPTGLYSYDPADPKSVASNIVLNGLTLQGGEFDIMVKDPDAAHDHTNFSILNSMVQYSYFQAIEFHNWNGGTVKGTTIAYNGLYNHPRGVVTPGWPVTVYGVNAENIDVTSNFLHDNDGEGIGPGSGSTGWLINRNIVYGNYSAEIYSNTDGKNGLTGRYDGGHIVVDRNLIYETDKYAKANPNIPHDIRNYPIGIGFANEAATKTQGTGQAFDTVTNNIIIGAGSAGIRVLNYGGSAFELTNSLFSNNTVAYMFNSLANGWTTTYYGLQIEVSDNVHVDNNIIYPDIVSLTASAGGTTGITASHNVVARQSSIQAGGRVAVLGTVVGDPGWCRGYQTTSPRYYVLQAGSVKLNAGYIVPAHVDGNVGTLAYDYFGNPRPANGAPDIGFYEHTGVVPTCQAR